MRSFCSAKASLIFSTKNFSIFGYKVVKHLTSWPLNELVKLTMLWTTGPRLFWLLFSFPWHICRIKISQISIPQYMCLYLQTNCLDQVTYMSLQSNGVSVKFLSCDYFQKFLLFSCTHVNVHNLILFCIYFVEIIALFHCLQTTAPNMTSYFCEKTYHSLNSRKKHRK